jgi:hypothetical protein
MTHPVRNGPAYTPASHGGLVDGRSTGASPSAAPRRPVLNDRRSTR